MAGQWACPPADGEEPARTKRLLDTYWWPLLRTRAGDCQDSVSLQLMPKVSGYSLLGLLFQWCTLLVQVTVAVLSGIGKHMDKGGDLIIVHIAIYAAVKFLWGYVLFKLVPCACRLTNTVHVLQYVTEGVSTLLLLTSSQVSDRPAADLRQVAFWFSFLPISYMMLMKLYDGVVVNIIINCCRKKFNLQTACVTLSVMVLALPRFIYRVASGGAAGSDGLTSADQLGRSVKATAADAQKQRAAKPAAKAPPQPQKPPPPEQAAAGVVAASPRAAGPRAATPTPTPLGHHARVERPASTDSASRTRVPTATAA